jgi:hypothetical protein
MFRSSAGLLGFVGTLNRCVERRFFLGRCDIDLLAHVIAVIDCISDGS